MKELDTAIILAGGLGTRLRPVVRKVPKPMAPVQGRPFIMYLLDYWYRQGIRRFIISVGYKSNYIRRGLRDLWDKTDLEFVKEDKPYGTGGALLLCLERKNIEFPFLLLNGDTFFEVNLKRLDRHARKTCADWCLSLFSSTDCERYLPIKLKQDFLVETLRPAISKNTKRSENFSNGGVYWVHPRGTRDFLLKAKSISLEKEMLPKAIKKGYKVVGFPTKKRFIDIGIPDDFIKAQAFRFRH